MLLCTQNLYICRYKKEIYELVKKRSEDTGDMDEVFNILNILSFQEHVSLHSLFYCLCRLLLVIVASISVAFPPPQHTYRKVKKKNEV